MAYSARISKVVHRQSQAPKSPMEWGARCNICPLKGTKPVYGDGPSAPVMNIVGEAPGMDEESMGIPMVGASGEELMKWLEKIGLVRQDVWITNACICRPAGNDMKSFLQRSRKEHKEKGLEFHHPVECCRNRLLYELKVPFCLSCGKYLRGPDSLVCTCKTPQLRKHAKGVAGPMAEVTVATGNMALESLRGVSGITEHRGYVEDLKARRNELVGVGSAASRTTVAIGGLTK